jgi:hypothetical protein
MWQHDFEHGTDLPVAAIWPILADVARWAEVDHNIERIEIAEAPAVGVLFRLKPKGGPMLRFVIGDFTAPTTYSDICRMPMARMKTLHVLEPEGTGTRLRVRITITGPLAWFWGRVVGRTHAAGLTAQTAGILTAARAGQRAQA